MVPTPVPVTWQKKRLIGVLRMLLSQANYQPVIASQYFSSLATVLPHQRKVYANTKTALVFCHCNMKYIIRSDIK